MDTYRRILEVAKRQLFASVPQACYKQFKAEMFASNCSRFSIYSAVLVFMDTGFLLVYLLSNLANGPNPAYLSVNLVKIALMLLLAFQFAHMGVNPYDPARPGHRFVDIGFPLLHVLGELALFVTGPQDFGAFARLLALPFVVGGIPILRQMKSLLLLAGLYVVCGVLLAPTAYGTYYTSATSIFNYWVVVFPCCCFVSFTVYSWYVNNFIASMQAKQAEVELAALNKKLDYLARHDALTGLYNRRGFNQYMSETWGRNVKVFETASIIMIDIDHFKRYNDRFGHLAGDECLQKVTAAMAEGPLEGREYLLARYGGEELIAVAYGASHEEMVQYAHQLRQKVLDLNLPHPDSGVANFVSVSVGLATQRTDALPNYETLIDWADECLYYAKRTGRNRLIHTRNERGNFTDIHGVSLVSKAQAEEYVRTFDEASTARILQDIGANCSFVYDMHRGELYFSKAAVAFFGTPECVPVSTFGSAARALAVATADKPAFLRLLRHCVQNREPLLTMELRIERQAQPAIPVSVTGQCQYDASGRLELCFGTVISISHMMDYNHFLMNQSMTNSVTLLPNRDKLNVDIRTALIEPEAAGYVIFLDIRQFHEINGHYGHSIGDKLLREVAFQLSRMNERYQPVYNYDVDQFVYLAKGATRADAQALMDQISLYYSTAPVRIGTIPLRIAFSVVAIPYSAGDGSADQLLLDIDRAVQTAKLQPSETGLFFDTDIKRETDAQFERRYALKRAVEAGFIGFELYYQPIVDAKSECCVGAEALLRWRDETGELVYPDHFIPMLEQSDLMGLVDVWVLNNAARQCRRWIDDTGNADLFINVNFSPHQLGNVALQEEVRTALRSNGLAPHNITLEITESFAITSYQPVLNTLRSLKSQGMRIAIDDFGTGYSSLSYLEYMPVNAVKIDRSFLQGIEVDETRRKFLFSIIEMVKSMDLPVCLEGVETTEQAEWVQGAHIEYMQGYHYGRPCPPAVFREKFLQIAS